MQSVVDAAPRATCYYSDAFNTYRELCWWGKHTAMYDKSQTYSVEAVNADLRHYLARLGRPFALLLALHPRAEASRGLVRAMLQCTSIKVAQVSTLPCIAYSYDLDTPSLRPSGADIATGDGL